MNTRGRMACWANGSTGILVARQLLGQSSLAPSIMANAKASRAGARHPTPTDRQIARSWSWQRRVRNFAQSKHP